MRHLAAICSSAAAMVACGSGGPEIDPLSDQIAAVGAPLSLELRASSRAGGNITFAYDTDADPDGRAQLNQRPGGSAVFTWNPTPEDIGAWTFDFHASDGSGKSTESIVIEVKSAIGAAGMPSFRRPLGAGTTLDLDASDCIELAIEVSDQDSTDVEIRLKSEMRGAELMDDGDQASLFRWCPDDQQQKEKERHILTFEADDGENVAAVKHYQVILRHGLGEGCRGSEPVIDHTPPRLEGLRDVILQAHIQDAVGLKAPPVVYYSERDPGSPPHLDDMAQVQMKLVGGDGRDGHWEATIPNPAAQRIDEGTKSLFYVIMADDNDDKGGTCDHVAWKQYVATIVAGTGTGSPGLVMCEPCSADVQCGGPDDLCLASGPTRDQRCFQSCDGGCPADSVCSASPLQSVDGAEKRQCIPAVGYCPGGDCEDDEYEPNSSREMATPLGSVARGANYDGARLCPMANLASDEDWYVFDMPEEGMLSVFISNNEDIDGADLQLYDESGELVAMRENWGTYDEIWRCMPAGTYRARVYSYYPEPQAYDITHSFEPMDCGGGQMSTCEDDLWEEDDDDPLLARIGEMSDGFNTTDNRICPLDDDWYYVGLEPGQTIYARLDFEQENDFQDLDLQLWEAEEMIVGCTQDEPAECDGNNGQSSDSGEVMRFTSTEGGYYILRVHGFGGSANSYDLCLSRSAIDCGLTP